MWYAQIAQRVLYYASTHHVHMRADVLNSKKGLGSMLLHAEEQSSHGNQADANKQDTRKSFLQSIDFKTRSDQRKGSRLYEYAGAWNMEHVEDKASAGLFGTFVK